MKPNLKPKEMKPQLTFGGKALAVVDPRAVASALRRGPESKVDKGGLQPIGLQKHKDTTELQAPCYRPLLGSLDQALATARPVLGPFNSLPPRGAPRPPKAAGLPGAWEVRQSFSPAITEL